MTFHSEIVDLAEAKCVKLNGRLDSATLSEFEKALSPFFTGDQNRVLLDFSELNYISSAGLRVILMAAKRAKQVQGRLVLCGLQTNVKEVFEISGFQKILDIAESQPKALEML